MQWLTWLLWLQNRNREYNGWFRESDIDYYIDGAMSEIREIKKSIREANNDELELEVWDLLWDVLSLINRLDHEWKIDINRVCPRAVAKFAERMPYNVLGYFEWDMARRHKTWETAKKLQKSRGIYENHPLVQKVWQSIDASESEWGV